MPPKSNVPIRIGGSKTRTGCRTCKHRHVKCDEQHPVCARCKKGNRHCIYDQPQSQSQLAQHHHISNQRGELAVSVSTQNLDVFQTQSPSRSPSPWGSRDPTEVGATIHFAVHLSKELAGCFSDDVWCKVLPRVAQVEPSIWHAMAAIGALDTSIRLGGPRNTGTEHRNTAIKQYNKAIHSLNSRLQSGDHKYRKDVILISCILFAVFECMQNHIQSALLHISSGTRLLLEWINEAQSQVQAKPGNYLNHKSLLPIFLALDSQAIQLGAVGFRDQLYSPAEDVNFQTPASFTTVDEAHILLSYIFNRISHWAEFVDPVSENVERPNEQWLISERQWLQAQLAKWDIAFDSSLWLFYPQPPVLLLLIQRTVMQAFFNKQMDGPSEMGWDRFLHLFLRAVEYAEQFIASNPAEPQTYPASQASQPEPTNASKTLFTINMDIVLPLFLISTKCRDRGVRRRALHLLRICGRKEGIWDSHKCSILAEKIMILEEAGAEEDGNIPESARIHMLDVTLNEDTGANITHKKLAQAEHDNDHAEVLNW